MIPEAILMTAAKPMIDSLMSKVIKPKIDQFVESCKLNSEELLIPRREHFEEYLYRTYKKYSIINTLVLKNEQRLLKDLYIPLTIVKEELHSKIKTTIKIDKYPSEIINEYNKILINDTAGMGKSTLTKYLFLDVIENGYGIPIYIEMRRLSKDRTILLDIQEQINSLSKTFDNTLLLRLIQTGGFVFFLDGFDEISLSERCAVTTDIQDFISKADNNIFIMTSRPEQALVGFGDFQMFSISSLSKKEAYELLRKYDKQSNTSKQLIDELKTGQYNMIDEFLQSPLLVSLLFAAFDYKHTIPLKKHIFYRQVYDAYFDSHDLSKGDSYIHDKSSGLDIDDFERVLRFVGYKSLQLQKIEFDKPQLLKIIDEAKAYCPDLDFCLSNFLNDLLTAVPLFCMDGQYYKWVHKSLQEYFAAQFIFKDSKKDQDVILKALFTSNNVDKYVNLLDLYYDIDNWGFKKNVLFPLCNSYINYYEKNIFSSNILGKDDIESRIGSLFMHEACIVKIEYKRENGKFNFLHFEELKKSVESILSKEVSSLIMINSTDCLCVFYHNYPQRKLFPLIKRRLPKLVKSVKRQSYEFSINYELNKIHNIDKHTYENDKDGYNNITFSISHGTEDNEFYICYNECMREKEEILNIMNLKDNNSNFIFGL